MANVKISDLPAASTPLTGAELVPIVQSGVTSQTTVDQVNAVLAADLSANSGSSLVGFLQSGTNAQATTVQAKLRETVSVKDFGAVGNGSHDDGPAIRNAIASMTSGGTLLFPAGSYYINTLVTSPYTFMNDAGAIFTGMDNFSVIGYGATITMSNAAAYSNIFQINQCSNFNIEGLTFIGNRTGLSSAQENVAISLVSCVNFDIENVHASGDWSVLGAAFAGNYLVNGRWKNIYAEQIGLGFDVAQLVNCSFENIYLKGSNGASGAGDRGFSLIWDSVAAAVTPSVNNTGYTITDSSNVSFKNFTATNFNAGMYFTSGQYLTLDTVFCNNNPGTSPSSPGIGALFVYATGTFSSSGHPVKNVKITNSSFNNNGSVVSGYGVYIDASSSSSDVFSNFKFENCDFINNNITGINVGGVSYVNGVYCNNVNFSGASQTLPVGVNLATNMVSNTKPQGALFTACPGYTPQNSNALTKALPTATGISSTVTISNASPAVITWASNVLSDGDTVTFSTTGTLPTGLTAGTTYYVINVATNTFNVSATSGGAAINTSSAGSGTHTCTVLNGSSRILTNNYPFSVQLTIWKNTAGLFEVHIIDPDNTNIYAGAGTIYQPVIVTLRPGDKIYFDAALPTSWNWIGLN